MFINYWFVLFSCIFFPVYWFSVNPGIRKIWLLITCLIFHYTFAGPAGVIPIFFMGVFTYIAGLSKNKLFCSILIVLCTVELIFYKYSTFLLAQFLELFYKESAEVILKSISNNYLPLAPPLAVSFFVFEFVHYLVDIYRGKEPIKSPINFTLFAIFWPSVVSGPIKRFEQFIPAVAAGCRNVSALDIQVGLTRITVGLIKKLLIAENLTRYIDFWQPQMEAASLSHRWGIVLAISLRILFDFSGYSDMAIGFARMMGIRIPENFRWPYIARNIQDFWQRWHISLSTWIRDYIYIPLGGNKSGKTKKVINVLLAFSLCGLWHGAQWNFIFWGLYHGLGLVIFTGYRTFVAWISSFIVFNTIININIFRIITIPLSWSVTFLFVSLGWLLFFYPINEVMNMLKLLMIVPGT